MERLGFDAPTPIQALALAPQLAGRDILAVASTGSGKTAAFGLPLLHRLVARPERRARRSCRALVLAPTRELAHQIAEMLAQLGRASRPRICVVTGGTPRRVQIIRLAAGVDIVVATPGRLADLMRARAIRLDLTRHLVIDEADRMLDLGFYEPVTAIAAALAPGRQVALFSATMPAAVAALATRLLEDPLRLAVPRPAEAAPPIRARAELIAVRAKPARLVALLGLPEVTRAIVFCRTRRGVDCVAVAIERAGITVALIHGERRQTERRAALARFRRGAARVLVATDIAARGIDVPGVSHVLNYDIPDDAESYVHRIGRTGRCGRSGEAISLCSPGELRKLRAIERLTRTVLIAAEAKARRRRRPRPADDAVKPADRPQGSRAAPRG